MPTIKDFDLPSIFDLVKSNVNNFRELLATPAIVTFVYG